MVRTIPRLEAAAKEKLPGLDLRGTSALMPEMAAQGHLNEKLAAEITDLRKLRNEVVHGNLSKLQRNDVERLKDLSAQLKDSKYWTLSAPNSREDMKSERKP